MSQGEFQIIERYFTRSTDDPAILTGIGDDAAVVRPSGPIAVAIDTLVAGVHFPERMPVDAVGYRALAVNLSDLAAMGAVARWCTLALTIPSADESWLESFSEGFFRLAGKHDVSLIGGDLTRGPLTVTVQVAGDVPADDVLMRKGGHAGDDVYVTGTLGDSAAGLTLFNEGMGEAGDEHRELQRRFLRPTPRLDEGQALRGVASAAIDISDGLVADLGHICEASGCGASIDVEKLPLSAEMLALFPPQAAQAYALTGGDDYELCFTASPVKAEAVEAAFEALGSTARKIGQLTEEPGVVCRRDGEPFAPPGAGYNHFDTPEAAGE